MPIYMFKCNVCKHLTEVDISFSIYNNKDCNMLAECSNKKCKAALYRENQQINFQGGINMNASAMGISQKKYSNKKGGPHGIVGKKVIGPSGVV